MVAIVKPSCHEIKELRPYHSLPNEKIAEAQTPQNTARASEQLIFALSLSEGSD